MIMLLIITLLVIMIGVQKLSETFSLHRMQQAFCRGAVSLRFRSKEQGMRVKDTFHFSRGQVKKNPVPRRSSVFLCSETIRKRLLRRLRDFLRYVFSCMHFLFAHQARPQCLHLYIARSGAISTSRRSYQIRHSEPVCFIECICSFANLKGGL